MRRVTVPEHSARTTFELSVGGIRDPSLRTRLLSIVSNIEEAESGYKIHGDAATFYEISPETSIIDRVTKDELLNVYKGSLSRRGSSSRHIYDAIKTAAQNAICPLCGHRHVSTLDHYLPQSLHPIFVVTPLNLIPSCTDCNKAKLDRQPSGAADQTLHPYFDDVNDEEWLKASVIQGSPPVVSFRAIPPACWDDLKRRRVCLHVKIFGLAELYSANAAQELVQIEYGLLKMSHSGSVGVRLHLLEQAESRRADQPNSWSAAFYTALAESEWFCNEGHRRISNRFQDPVPGTQ